MNDKTNLSWAEAAIEVLKTAGSAMHYTDIANEIVKRGLRKSVGATPANSLNTAMFLSLRDEGEKSPFLKVKRGEYWQRGKPLPTDKSEGGESPEPAVEEPEESVGIIQAFGMYWRREMVLWKKEPELLGEQQQGATVVNFCDQRGIYLLHDGRETVYVGRTTDQPLGARMLQHTYDRLSTRWDRFSWFGLCQVTDQGKLVGPDLKNLSAGLIIATMEALLIEGLEPRQNRKRGDDFRAVEYIQSEDPQIRKKRMAGLLAELQQKIGN